MKENGLTENVKKLKGIHEQIQSLDNTNHPDFWGKNGKIGVGKERQNNIPMEVILPCGNISFDTAKILENILMNYLTLDQGA